MVTQLRAGHLNGTTDESLFGMFESNGDARIAQQMAHLLPGLLKHEQSLKEMNSSEYMKYTLLTAQRQCGGCLSSALIFHLMRLPSKVRALKSKRYVLRMASLGYFDAYLVRRTTHLRLTQPETHLDTNKRLQVHSLTDPQLLEVRKPHFVLYNLYH